MSRFAPSILCLAALLSFGASSMDLMAWQKALRLERLTPEQGLPDQSYRSSIQDEQGFMWFATDNVLVRYDGYEYTVYRHDPGDPGWKARARPPGCGRSIARLRPAS